jgi:hypothetical protein
MVRYDVIGVLRPKLVAYRSGTTVSPLLAGGLPPGNGRTSSPALGWGNPVLFE